MFRLLNFTKNKVIRDCGQKACTQFNSENTRQISFYKRLSCGMLSPWHAQNGECETFVL